MFYNDADYASLGQELHSIDEATNGLYSACSAAVQVSSELLSSAISNSGNESPAWLRQNREQVRSDSAEITIEKEKLPKYKAVSGESPSSGGTVNIEARKGSPATPSKVWYPPSIEGIGRDYQYYLWEKWNSLTSQQKEGVFYSSAQIAVDALKAKALEKGIAWFDTEEGRLWLLKNTPKWAFLDQADPAIDETFTRDRHINIEVMMAIGRMSGEDAAGQQEKWERTQLRIARQLANNPKATVMSSGNPADAVISKKFPLIYLKMQGEKIPNGQRDAYEYEQFRLKVINGRALGEIQDGLANMAAGMSGVNIGGMRSPRLRAAAQTHHVVGPFDQRTLVQGQLRERSTTPRLPKATVPIFTPSQQAKNELLRQELVRQLREAKNVSPEPLPPLDLNRNPARIGFDRQYRSPLSVAPNSGLRGTAFSQNVRSYIDAIERHTGFRLHSSQRTRLADNLRTNSYSRLSSEAGEAHRRLFTQRVKNAQIAEWERQTGQAWPRYTQDLVNSEGIVLRKAGDPFDAHHVIENIYGGPHEWWNLTPARFPDQHQGGLHLEAIMDTLFP